MRRWTNPTRAWAAAGLALATLFARAADAHERFIKHNLLVPLDPNFFIHDPDRWGKAHPHAQSFLSIDINIWKIGLNTAAVMSAFIMIWFVRHPLSEFVQFRLLRFVRGRPQRWLNDLACFVTDRPVRNRAFNVIREWVVIFFLRSPGLVLMYSASNDSLVMPSYPLDPASATLFKFAQVGLAILIFTQTALPLCGAMIIGTWFYLFRWGWMVSVDAVPVLTVAVIYVTSPWQSHRLAITDVNATQIRWARIVLGAGFLALGYLKIYNYNLTGGVADNYPSVLKDPMVKLLATGTDPHYLRECWIVSFASAEILSGFLLMIGVFSRVWATIMTFMFTKLMLVDFGWNEIPHIYPIAAMLTIITSNKLTSVLDDVEARNERLSLAGERPAWVAGVIGPAVAVAFSVVFPMLYFVSFFDRSNL
jgi:uncharacterized membrane protein YphA (DoxX/SURF4 family)